MRCEAQQQLKSKLSFGLSLAVVTSPGAVRNQHPPSKSCAERGLTTRSALYGNYNSTIVFICKYVASKHIVLPAKARRQIEARGRIEPMWCQFVEFVVLV